MCGGEYLVRTFVKKVFCILFIIGIFINIVYADSVSSDVEDEMSILVSIETIEKDLLVDLINSNEIISITQAGHDLYLKTENKIFRYRDNSDDTSMLIYLSLNGYTVNIISESEFVDEDGTLLVNKKTGAVSFLEALLILVCFSGIAWYIYKVIKGYLANSNVSYSDSAATNTGTSIKDRFKKNNDSTAPSVPSVRFSDVEGIEGLKNDIFRLVDCLKNPNKYDDIGARTPKGVILYGPPGTGKTLLAKAIAGEAGVPFFSAVGSDFIEKYVGVGAKRVRELYSKARKSAPCIVFIDEIDSVARQRGKDDNSERDQTINALLSELDGFSSTEKIITICATNRLDMLDNAFKRAGRFDLKLAVGLPDKEGRHNILKIHSANKKLAEDIDLEKIAIKCSGFSGAELETLLNEAALIAVGKSHSFINNEDIEDAFFKIVMQGNKKPRKEIDEMNKIVAWHEAGHTLVTKLLTEDSVPSVTIIGSSSGAGGVTFRTPKNEGLQSKKYLKALIGIMYAGRAAEELYLGNSEMITNGASQDIKQATEIIREYLAIYGMGDLGMIDITQLRSDFEDIVTEASELSKEIYHNILDLLRINKNKLVVIAERLLEKETLYEDEIDSIIKEYS